MLHWGMRTAVLLIALASACLAPAAEPREDFLRIDRPLELGYARVQERLEAVRALRPTVGLHLSGGSARAFAHLGVLRRLEEEGLYPDVVVTNSMGSVIGLLYAAGVPLDVIEEYTRPARYLEFGRVVTRPALSDPEFIHFPGIGTLEAFNSDGLRTMLTTIKADSMKEKTLRYPGHIEKIAVLRETGFFSKEPIEISGARITPLEFTARILFPKWKLDEGEGDLTVMQVTVKGRKDGAKTTHHFDLLDRYDPVKRVISMARTTGYTATVAARMVHAGLYDTRGVSAPEFIGGNPRCVEFLLDGLARRGIHYTGHVT